MAGQGAGGKQGASTKAANIQDSNTREDMRTLNFMLRNYNVLVYEPEGTQSGLKIAKAVLADVVARSNKVIEESVLPQFVRLGLIPEGTDLDEFAAGSYDPDSSASQIAVPEENRFIVNTAPYQAIGKIPGVLGEFADMYDRLASGGIAVTFLNTAYESPVNDFSRLTELLDEFPAMLDSTLIVTASLRQPMPKGFKEKIAELKQGAPGGKGGRHLAVTEGRPCTVPIGDSIVLTAKDEAARVIFDRLQYLRRWEGRSQPLSP